MSGETVGRRRGLLYGRRKGPKLSARQQSLVDNLLPKLSLTLRNGADPRRYFSPPPGGEAETRSASGGVQVEDVWLEVGFGGGEHLLWQAQRHPNTGLIGAEPYLNGVAKVLARLPPSASPELCSGSAPPPQAGEDSSRIGVSYPPPFTGEVSAEAQRAEADGGGNIRIYMGDARDILEALPDASLGRVFILFPDPWPKTRHSKRRFIQMDTLDELARVMKPAAEMRFASDEAAYVEWTLERLTAHPAFEWTAQRASDWKTRPADWPPTRYEIKQLHGKPVYLRFSRR